MKFYIKIYVKIYIKIQIQIYIKIHIKKVKFSRNRPRWPKGFQVGYGPGFS